MSESDSESDAAPPSEKDDGPIFPYEKLYYSAKDKEEIMALPEIEREQILSERAQQVDRHNQDLALRRLLASREREEARAKAKQNKRKASTAELEEGQRKSSRQKTTLGGRKVGETSDAMEAYKRQREEKGKREELRRRDAASKAERRRSRSRDGGVSDADAEGESEAEWGDKDGRTPPVPKGDPPAELRDFQRVRVGRSNFAQVCFYPGFDEAISGCYTRVNIGPNRETGQNEYRMCLIKSMFMCFLPTWTLLTPLQGLPRVNLMPWRHQTADPSLQTSTPLWRTEKRSASFLSSLALTLLLLRFVCCKFSNLRAWH